MHAGARRRPRGRVHRDAPRPGAADRARRRLQRGHSRAVHLARRPARRAPGRAASGGPRARAHRPRAGAAALRPGHPQDRGLPPGDGAAARPGRRRRPHPALAVLRRGRAGAAAALLDRGCTGIFCASDLMALGAIRAARERGLSVPGDVSVVGFDDSPLMAFTDPPLTTVRKPIGAMAAAAVETLLEEIGGTPAKHVELIYQPELVVRGSTSSGPLVNR
ncbi:substrate-binding domain-containing protein [Microbispora sp. GKU 823]|uniref:substrate-binding domain-containing protein n=1 Tax=Microbispora sp. GKU 823 TaxID=1652100 RepID=UPI0021192E93|nr:substrate-binding domain-containing protein [Microbispora sp. GKU 823]